MTEERQPNTELREKARELLEKHARNLYEASELLREVGHGMADAVFNSHLEALQDAASIQAEARIELEAAEQRGDEYKAALGEVRAQTFREAAEMVGAYQQIEFPSLVAAAIRRAAEEG